MSFRVYSGPVWQRHAIEAGPALPAEQPCSYTAVTGNQNMPLPVVCRGPQRAAWTTPAAGARAGVSPNLGHAVPARLPSPRDGVVHDVIRHQEEGLQLRPGNQAIFRCRVGAMRLSLALHVPNSTVP